MAVVVAQRQVYTYNSINYFFGIIGMFTVRFYLLYMGGTPEPGQVHEEHEEEAEKNIRKVGVNLDWLLKKICHD